VAKRQRRLSSIDEIVLSLYARGLSSGDIAAHFAEIYDARLQGHHLSDHRPGGWRRCTHGPAGRWSGGDFHWSLRILE
jgi:hypothetical protein